MSIQSFSLKLRLRHLQQHREVIADLHVAQHPCRHPFHVFGAQKEIQSVLRLKGGEGVAVGVHDFEPAGFGQVVELAGTLEDVEVPADDDVLAAVDDGFELLALLAARALAQGKVHHEQLDVIGQADLENELLGAALEVLAVEMERFLRAERVAVIAEERQEPQGAAAAVFHVCMEVVTLGMRDEAVLAVDFHKAAEVRFLAAEQVIERLANLADDAAGRIQVAIALQQIALEGPVQPGPIPDVIEQNAHGMEVFLCC